MWYLRSMGFDAVESVEPQRPLALLLDGLLPPLISPVLPQSIFPTLPPVFLFAPLSHPLPQAPQTPGTCAGEQRAACVHCGALRPGGRAKEE